MSAKEIEKYQDDAVIIDDAEVKRVAERCMKFRWLLTDDESYQAVLREKATEEAKSIESPIVLTRFGCTPKMESLALSRMNTQIAKWDEVKTEFINILSPHSDLLEATASIKNDKSNRERERDTLKQSITSKWQEEKKAFRDDRKEAAEAEKRYDQLYEKHGNRHAKTINYWLYIPLLATIGLVEWLINWEAANALFAQPYLAAGIVMVIALAVAAASHEHGTLVKQWSYRCGFMADSATRIRNYTALGFTTLLFIAAMALVGYMRYKLAYEDLLGGASFGGSNPFGARGTISEVYTATAMTLMGNLIVWILGAMVAYWLHDSDPHFSDARVRHVKASARFSVWSRRMEKFMREEKQRLTVEIDQLDNTLNSRISKGRRLVDICEQVLEHEQMLLKRLKENVDNNLQTYHYQLIALVRTNSPEATFIDPTSGGSDISATAYDTRKIEIPREYIASCMDIKPFTERRAAKQRQAEE